MDPFRYGFPIPSGGITANFRALHNPAASGTVTAQVFAMASGGVTCSVCIPFGETVPIVGWRIIPSGPLTGFK